MATDPRAPVKARMTSSLFNTRGEDGQRTLPNPATGPRSERRDVDLIVALEQYITHVKITEDSAHPSTPPPNFADTSNRKQRFIVVSVQRNGIVRMHKTRENANGTFSIGKTWAIDSLERLEETDTLGFIITIQKPYYWMTETTKDKYAFVTALIQVYRKFTGGKTPEIIGFESIFRSTPLAASQNSRRQSPPSNPYVTPPQSKPQVNPYTSPPPQANPYASPPQQQVNPYTSPPQQVNPYASPPPPVAANPYAANPSPVQSNPYAPSPTSLYGSAPSNPYAAAASNDPYAAPSVAPLKPQRLPSESSVRRPYAVERIPSRESSRGSPERERPRSKDRLQQPDGIVGVVPPMPIAPLSISRQASASPSIRSTPSETLQGSYETASIRSRRAEDDTASLNSVGSRSRGPRAMASAPALKASAMTSSRALAESPLPGQTASAGRSTPPTPPTTNKSSKHGPKLSISTSTSVPSRLQNGGTLPADSAATPRMKSPLRKRPKSVDESAAPSEEAMSAAMLEIESLLTSFDWTHPTPCAMRLETLLTDEYETVESENVHALVMNDGPQMHDFVAHLDDGIKQCEELDEMLTLYLVELQALADDVNFIESENRGLHVRTANERALEKELSDLLNAMSIAPREFEVLKQQSLEKQEGIDRVEQSLLQIYLALKASAGLVDQEDEDGPKENMQIVREMRRMTRTESEKFLARLREFVKIKFQAELMSIPPSKSKTGPVFPDHSTSYSYFYRYAGFILFAKEVDKDSYADIKQLYLSPAGRSYREDFRGFVNQWKTSGRKAISDDLELIFSMAKEPQGGLTAVRSASIKRTGTKILRSPMIDDGPSRAEKDRERERLEQEGKVPVGEIFGEILSIAIPAFVKEQSFVMEFLHLSPSGKYKYEQFLSTTDRMKWMVNLDKKRPPELDKAASKEVMNAMEQLLSWLPDELSGLVEWCRTQDALQLVTVLGALESQISEWEDSDQTFILTTLNKQHDKLAGVFNRFVEEQVRTIEDMKVTAKKRQGVLLMFKIFPGFVEKVEAQFESPVLTPTLEVRETVNEAYEKISKTMFDSLQAIAKDSSSHQASGSKDDDDKEQLNSHISMIENMHYYRETVDDRGNKMLMSYKTKAQGLYAEHLALYLNLVIRRPLGRLLDFLQGVETFVVSNPSEDVTARISFSKSAFRKVLSHYDTKELRKGIDLLYKRVDKHFGHIPDENDALYSSKGPAISRGLVQDVWKECQKEYQKIVELCTRIISIYYPEVVQMEFTNGDVQDAFSKRGV